MNRTSNRHLMTECKMHFDTQFNARLLNQTPSYLKVRKVHYECWYIKKIVGKSKLEHAP
ncbi:predicted protein [Sclerotinia sclerotiorum 1980 UF-70]|uniref:Uncharacterized protein n=1 Tax=Sclerotinia sclerotiorum (strain ATCC 18683 / 1980 / Ss-1) TaxID=665079 RepID=A7EL42_SCLS1|nr:predicted protein [Sclerotinia sclerotiorum 1980 UF-70]EDO03558.1 predicted protein [Sclerotinia sclerotiorum 1980 UF-70]